MFAMLAINEGQALNMQTLGVPIGIFGAFVVAHIATRILAPEADPPSCRSRSRSQASASLSSRA